ncbi:hypothetical protein AKJ45_03515 [candidate division MSBL1 archaeon SCGC-AAA261F19]|uniref:Uncharacterized protein n=1 Tax=candidate division MSBL1 archaeon SCGC-AAA261F19 TaxID=1698275 RepID=A0A133V7L0_9EURY|nr:hypothetical protein AKJ45_03515 [candidate division MSBL1 archaeon SCGC-AAA261F19]
MRERKTTMAKDSGMLRAFAWCTVLTVVVIFSAYNVTSRNLTFLAGPLLIGLGLLPLAVLKGLGQRLASVGADVAFGAFDTGFMTVAALAGATFAGILGAVVGAGAGDAITDAWAGLIEGKVASWLRDKGIDEARRPFNTSMGKMSGCLLGAGVTVSLASLIGVL